MTTEFSRTTYERASRYTALAITLAKRDVVQRETATSNSPRPNAAAAANGFELEGSLAMPLSPAQPP